MLSHVLIPLDSSLLAEKALDAAKPILRPQGKITLVMAVQTPTPPIFAYPSADVLHEIERDLAPAQEGEQDAHEYLERIAKNLTLLGYSVDIEVQHGDPAQVILEMAEKLRVDIIIMSTHGRSGLGRLLFGSVTNQVLGASYCPVLVVPNRERQPVKDEQVAPGTGPSLAT